MQPVWLGSQGMTSWTFVEERIVKEKFKKALQELEVPMAA